MTIIKAKARDFYSLEILDEYQGKSLSLDDSFDLSNIQNDLIQKCFLLGLKGIKGCTLKPYKAFFNYFEKINKGSFLNENFSFIEEQNQLYEIIHTATLSDPEKLFLEFSVGLSRFVLSVQLISKFVDYLCDKQLVTHEKKVEYNRLLQSKSDTTFETSFFKRISNISYIAVELINIVSQRCTSNSFLYWNDADNFFKTFKQMDNIARALVSIQYVPNNVRFLSVMQTMHWRGFGGSGEILIEHDDLRELAIHSFSHHTNYKVNELFNKRLIVFKAPLESILAGTQRLIANFLEKKFPGDILQLHDFCSGPYHTAVKGIFEKMPNRIFNLTVSDVDGRSLAELIKAKNNCITPKNVTITNVCYEDLMQPLQLNKNLIEKYHLVSVNLGLHQLSLEKIYAALRYFTLITKIGGLISNLDASEQRYKQLMVIPGNLVDREGHVPFVEDMDLSKLMVVDEDKEYIKIAYPMHHLVSKVISEIDERVGLKPYMVSFYTPVRIKLSDFKKLNYLWKLKCYNGCDEIINKYFINFIEFQASLLKS